MRTALLAALTTATILIGVQPGFAQPAEELKALRKEIEGVKESQKSIQKDLQEIKSLLKARPEGAVVTARPVAPAAGAPGGPAAAQEAVISLEGAPFRGDKNARVTMVEFTDYQ